jgi:hypothetical protein
MRRKKQITIPRWFIWDGYNFPESSNRDSVVFYLDEHVYLDEDNIARQSLAKQIQQEGISSSLFEAFQLIEKSNTVIAGYKYSEADELSLVFCDYFDDDLDYDATFVEVLIDN